MRKALNKGSGNAEGIAILAVVIVIMLISFSKGVSGPGSKTPSASRGSASGIGKTVASGSSKTSSVSIGVGNASYSYQPYDEYINLYSKGVDVDITGWQLRNAKDERTYNIGGTLQNFQADSAIIGQGALFVSPTVVNKFQDIILKQGESAIVTTGKVGV